MKNTVFLYAGQGSQKPGMGADFYEQSSSYHTLARKMDPTGQMIDLMTNGPIEDLSLTENTQICMAIFAAGVTEILKDAGIRPAAACGLSLGEYGALYAAGVFDAVTYGNLLRFRGKAMKEAAEGSHCSMSAILGCDSRVIAEACESYAAENNAFVAVANYNCPGQTVICGVEEAVAAVEADLKTKGARRCVRLNVSGPFHTPYMAAAGEALKDYFADLAMAKPAIPVCANVTGDFYGEKEDPKELLVQQVQSPVHLEDNLKALLAAGYTDYIEIGPGNTMAGFLKKTAREMGVKVQVCSIETSADLIKLLNF